MMLKAIIIEQLEGDGTLRTFTMQPDTSTGHITVAFPDEYLDSHDGPFHFLDHRDEVRFSKGFARCRARRLGDQRFRRDGDVISVKSLRWSGIPTERGFVSYYALSFPKWAIPKRLSITDPHQPGREYRREIAKDTERNRFTVYLECSSSYGRFDFVLSAELYFDQQHFAVSNYSDPKTNDGYHVHDEWKCILPRNDGARVQQFFAQSIQVGDSHVDKSTLIGGSLNNSAFAANSPQTIQTITVNPKLNDLLEQIIKVAESDSNITKSQYSIIVKEVDNLKAEMTKPKPSRNIVERIMGILGSVASIASLVDRMAPFLPALFT